jgi:hypothetical protein
LTPGADEIHAGVLLINDTIPMSQRWLGAVPRPMTPNQFDGEIRDGCSVLRIVAG